MLKKHFITLLLLVSVCFVRAQDTIEYIEEPPSIEEFTPLRGDTVTTAVDTITFREHSFSSDFKEKYKGENFIYERKPKQESAFDRLLKWLSEFFGELFGNNAGNGINYVMWIFSGLILLAVVYFIVRAILNKESMWIFGRQRKKIYAEDAAQQNIHEMDFDALIAETKATGNYRLAVRYYYLLILKRLSFREIITWHWQKTNSDYLYEIKDSSLRKDFEYLSYLYDYSWYGEFPLDETSFSKAEKAFQKTLNTL